MDRIRTGGGKNFEFLKAAHRYAKAGKISGVGLEGGSRSGKTYDTGTFVAYLLTEEEGKVFTIGRDWLKTLKDTTYQSFRKSFQAFGFPVGAMFNKSATDIRLNGNLVRFVGVNDNIMNAHGMEQDYLFLNEAMSVPKDVFDQMEQRTSVFWWVDYNPSADVAWLYDLEKRPDYRLLKTTVLDNKFAPPKQRAKIMSYEPTPENIARGTADPWKWKVYGLGQRAARKDTIFPDWSLYSIEPEERADPVFPDLHVFGLDFGNGTSPNAVVQVKVAGKDLYLREILYDPHLSNQGIKDALHSITADTYVVCDSADPRSIGELRGAGNALNAIPAEKGPGSVVFGIKQIKKFRIFVHTDSENLQKELREYKWTKLSTGEVALNGKGQPIPKKGNDHAIDAARYALTKFRI